MHGIFPTISRRFSRNGVQKIACMKRYGVSTFSTMEQITSDNILANTKDPLVQKLYFDTDENVQSYALHNDQLTMGQYSKQHFLCYLMHKTSFRPSGDEVSLESLCKRSHHKWLQKQISIGESLSSDSFVTMRELRQTMEDLNKALKEYGTENNSSSTVDTADLAWRTCDLTHAVTGNLTPVLIAVQYTLQCLSNWQSIREYQRQKLGVSTEDNSFRILDIGCGTGIYGAFLRAALSDPKYSELSQSLSLTIDGIDRSDYVLNSMRYGPTFYESYKNVAKIDICDWDSFKQWHSQSSNAKPYQMIVSVSTLMQTGKYGSAGPQSIVQLMDESIVSDYYLMINSLNTTSFETQHYFDWILGEYLETFQFRLVDNYTYRNIENSMKNCDILGPTVTLPNVDLNRYSIESEIVIPRLYQRQIDFDSVDSDIQQN